MSLNIPSAPNDFQPFWDAVESELDLLPVAAELTPVPLRTTEFATLYELRLTSIGPYRIFAYYSIPKGDGPFPVLCHMPGYGSVVHIASYEERQQFVTVALRHRGQRLADKPFAASYPGLLTTGIETPESYIYRGIVADCCRMIDFLDSRPEVDSNKIAVVGNDLALFSAALRPQVDALYCTPSLFFAAAQLAQRTSAYPLEELNDFSRSHPKLAPAMWRTLSYFEPTYFAPQITAATMLVTGDDKDLFSPAALEGLIDAFAVDVETYASQHSSYRDGVHQAAWLAKRYGLGELILPPHWQPAA